MEDWKERAVMAIYLIGNVSTLVYLTFLDGFAYSAWNWIVAIPVNVLLSSIWPIYWLLLRPLFGV